MARMKMPDISFTRLPDIDLEALVVHMADPRVAKHMPLFSSPWTTEIAARFVAAKEECWSRDGLGHWAILADGNYIGWGGFQKEGDEWDFGLVLKPDAFGLGWHIVRKALEFAGSDARIEVVTFLLPPSRRNQAALARLGADFVAQVEYSGATFMKYRLETRRATIHAGEPVT